jgi:3-phosphoshikimate 1-carboxyvinyltransferase
VDARRIEPLTEPPDATVVIPGSKSLTNRALLAAALAAGTSVLEGALVADDTEAMASCVAQLGARVRRDDRGTRLEVDGRPPPLPSGPLDLQARQSGVTGRFVLPVLALGAGPYRLDASEQLRARPMADSIEALRALGLTVEEEGRAGALPVVVRGGPVAGGSVAVRGDVSSQFLSGLLLAGPAMSGGLHVSVGGPLVSRPYVDLTLAVLGAFGAHVAEADTAQGTAFDVRGPYRATRYRVEPDASAASYFFAAAAICGGRVRVAGLGDGALQGDVAFADLLGRMGAEVTRTADWLEVRGRGPLRGVDADLRHISDTVPTLAAVAAFASTPSRVRGVGFIRGKESDRIGAVVAELRRCGIEAVEHDDGFVVHPGAPQPAQVHTYADHRMAMSFALLGLRAPGIEILDPGCVAKTFPTYFDVLDSLRRPATPTGIGQ